MEQFKSALDTILSKIAKSIPENANPVFAIITGGTATYLYTEARASDDIDMIISHRIEQFPNDLRIVWQENGGERKLGFDYNYNSTLGLMHEDYLSRTTPYKTYEGRFHVSLLSPVDIIISKILRFEENDERDIESLVKRFKISREEVFILADDAIKVGVGFREEKARQHLEWTLDLIDKVNTD